MSREYCHLVRDLEVYPRVYHFSRRYDDVLRKFTKVTKKYPHPGLKSVPDLRNIFRNGITIKVIGKDDLAAKHFVNVKSSLFITETHNIPSKFIDMVISVDPFEKHNFKSDLKTKTFDVEKETTKLSKTLNKGSSKRKTSGVENTTAKLSKTPRKGGSKRKTSGVDKTTAKLSKKLSKEETDSTVYGISEGVKTLGIDQSTPDVCFTIYYTNAQTIDEAVQECSDYFKTPTRRETQVHVTVCIWRCSRKLISQDKDAFRKLLNEFGHHIDIVVSEDTDADVSCIGTKISDHLEGVLALRFDTLTSFIKKYKLTDEYRSLCKTHLLEDDKVLRQIECILSNLGYAEVMEVQTITELQKNEDESQEKQEQQHHHHQQQQYTRESERLSKRISCALVAPLAQKYSVPLWICSRVVWENNLESRIEETISDQTKNRLKQNKISPRGKEDEGKEDRRKWQKYETELEEIRKQLQEELKEVVLVVGRKVNRISTELKKMLLEIAACKKKMIVVAPKADTSIHNTTKTAIDETLRKQILRIDEVYGIGTFYGQFEVHVKNEDDVSQVEDKILNLMTGKKLPIRPIAVRAIRHQPKDLAATGIQQYEHGSQLVCSDMSGTLGGFIDGNDSHLYGLTCAHVVNGNEDDVHVYINCQVSSERVLFARKEQNLIVSTGTHPKPRIDIAAVRVLDDMRRRCVRFLKNEDGNLKPPILPADETGDVVNEYVYKHGAKTGLTEGFICSDDYNILNEEDLTYMMIIDKYDGLSSDSSGDDSDDAETGVAAADDDTGNASGGDTAADDGAFAKRGDSGSMVCKPDEPEVHVVNALGILCSGEYIPVDRDTPLCFSFRLLDGLRKLTAQNNNQLQFSVPKDFI